MVCKCFLTFSRLPFLFVDCFLCCAEAISFGVDSLVDFFSFAAFAFVKLKKENKKQKTKNSVKTITFYVPDLRGKAFSFFTLNMMLPVE